MYLGGYRSPNHSPTPRQDRGGTHPVRRTDYAQDKEESALASTNDACRSTITLTNPGRGLTADQFG